MTADSWESGGAPAGAVSLQEVDAGNWRDCADLEVRPDQREFVSPVCRYLALCHYDGVWHPLAVCVADRVVGFVMWAVDPTDNSGWIGGLTIDQGLQGRGFGKGAVLTLVRWLEESQGCTSAALSYSPENVTARALYSALGFTETGEMEDDEMVARMAF